MQNEDNHEIRAWLAAFEDGANRAERIYWHSQLHAFSHQGHSDKYGGVPVYKFENNYQTSQKVVNVLKEKGFIALDEKKSTPENKVYSLTAAGRECLKIMDETYGASLLQKHWKEPQKFNTEYHRIVNQSGGNFFTFTPS